MSSKPVQGDIVQINGDEWVVVSSEDRLISLVQLNIASRPQAAQPAHERPSVPNVVGVEEAARILGTTPKTVREYLRTGQLAGKKVGRRWRILRSENPMLMAV